MTRLLQVWLGFRLYVTCNYLYDMVSKAIVLRVFWTSPFNIVIAVVYVLDIIGMAVLFAKHKKIGFYLMLASSALAFVIALCMGEHSLIALGRAMGVVPMTITYLLMAKRWNEFS